MDQIRMSLDEAIAQTLEVIKSSKSGSDERAEAIKELKELHAARIEELKAEQAQRDSAQEECTRAEQNRFQKFDTVLKAGVQVGVAIGGWLVYDGWFRRGLHFETHNTVGSPWTRNLINRMLPKK